MSDLASIRAALEECYGSIERLCADLTTEAWDTQSLCPDWTVRGVVEHLAGIEQVMAGWLPESPDDRPAFGRAAALAEEAAALDNDQFRARVREVFDERRGDLARLRETDLERPSWTPVGPGTYGRFLDVRVFDFWVHERDITTPLHRATDDSGPRAEMTLAEIEGSLGYVVGKKIGIPDGRSIVFHITGPLRRDLSVVVDGRARVVDHVDDPDVEVTSDLLTFVQLACGRIDPQGPIDAGSISWTGDAALGEQAARNLRFTI